MQSWLVSYRHDVAYELAKCVDLFDPDNESLLGFGRGRGSRRFVVVDERVHDLHSAALRSYFEKNEVDARVVSRPAGETNKSIEAYLALLSALDEFPIDRRDEPIIAIGGGVITDLTGFLAATYRRGIPCVRVPTTLIGYVDASVGIKTGVNVGEHKNRLGAFAPPARVLLDRSFLRTLPRRHVLNGVCEIFKLAVISDLRLFEQLETYGRTCIESQFQDEPGIAILDHAIQRTLDELRSNLYEDDLARTLDFGHTFAYGLETCPGSTCLHGEAVLLDVLISSNMAHDRGFLAKGQLERIIDLAARLDLIPALEPVHLDVLWDSVLERTLHRNGRQRIPLPVEIGKCVFVDDVDENELLASGTQLMAQTAARSKADERSAERT